MSRVTIRVLVVPVSCGTIYVKKIFKTTLRYCGREGLNGNDFGLGGSWIFFLFFFVEIFIFCHAYWVGILCSFVCSFVCSQPLLDQPIARSAALPPPTKPQSRGDAVITLLLLTMRKVARAQGTRSRGFNPVCQPRCPHISMRHRQLNVVFGLRGGTQAQQFSMLTGRTSNPRRA